MDKNSPFCLAVNSTEGCGDDDGWGCLLVESFWIVEVDRPRRAVADFLHGYHFPFLGGLLDHVRLVVCFIKKE